MTTAFTQDKPIDPENLDKSVRPQDDFNMYANGKWLERNPVPEDRSKWGLFEQLAEKNNLVLREIMEEAAAVAVEKGTNKQKVGDFWKAAMDEEQLEKLGATPLAPVLDLIDKVADATSLVSTIGVLHRQGLCPLWGLDAEGDLKNSDIIICWLDHGGLGLPDRDYYFLEEKEDIRKKYVVHVARMLTLLGSSAEEAAAGADQIMKIETALAKNSLTRVERRDPMNLYHKMTMEELAASAPGLDWQLAFNEMLCPAPGDVNVTHPPFFQEVAKMISAVPLGEWKTYLRWHSVNSAASYLSKAFVDANFDFYGTVLTGQPSIKPRWKRVLAWANHMLGDMVGEVYCQREFPAEAKQRAKQIVDKLVVALRERLQSLEWMGAETKSKALLKLDSFGVKIGYPDEWVDYSSLEIDSTSLLSNVLRATEFEHLRQVKRMGKPLDKNRWEMAPQTVNAYYHPLRNEIVFPAAILQFPMFSSKADPAVNYGAMGAVIGHEMTHGFDDQGRKFDHKGNMVEWWTEEDAKSFSVQAKAMVDLFSTYEVHGLKVNGELTQGENIADFGGLKVAYAALMAELAETGGGPGDIEGFTQQQRFFLSWAQCWRCNIREEQAKERLVTDPHSPEIYRILGPLSQFPEFHAAFGIKEGDKMFLPQEKRACIW